MADENVTTEAAPPEEVSLARMPPMMEDHPMEPFLRMDRIPHIWCPMCGIGTCVSCLIEAIEELDLDTNKLSITSGIGCTGRVAGYMKLDSFHTTHGRGIPFATGLCVARPDMTHIVMSGDGDLAAIGGNHLFHAARRNMPLKVFCVNNFIYGMTGGQVTPTTPQTAFATTSPYGNFEMPFNLPKVMAACGATYVARWTALHIRRLKKAYKEALLAPGFAFVEAIAPCPTLYSRRNRLGSGLDLMKFYHQEAIIDHDAKLEDLDIAFQKRIVCGKFVDSPERPTFLEAHRRQHIDRIGDRHTPYSYIKALRLAGADDEHVAGFEEMDYGEEQATEDE